MCLAVSPVLLLVLLLQIFVEIERARLTRKLAAMREAEGNIAEAADTLQEVAVVSSCCGCSASVALEPKHTAVIMMMIGLL
jgi:hypothetical protein